MGVMGGAKPYFISDSILLLDSDIYEMCQKVALVVKFCRQHSDRPLSKDVWKH